MTHMRIPLRLVPVVLALSVASPAHALSPVACTMDAKLCPDGVTYVGRDGNNDCEWQACPGEEGACTAEQCGEPSIAMPNWQCPDASTGGPVCTRTDDGSCGWVVRDCPNDSKFSDVPTDHPNSDAIFYVRSAGIVQGYEDGTFKPDATINRAEFVKILVAATAVEDGPVCKIAPFSDVDQTAWYATYAHEARCLGLVQGYPDGSFKPADPINFVEAAKIVANAFHIAAPGMAQDDAWYKPYVTSLERAHAIPTSITRFGQSITRGEMAEMIYRLRMGGDKPSKTFDELQFMVFCDGRIATGDATCE